MMSAFARAAALILAGALLFGAPSCPAQGPAPRAGGLHIEITAPANGSTVKGDVVIAGTASGPEGAVLSVQVSLDSGSWHDVDGNLSWSWLWSTFADEDGLHTISSRVTDGTGTTSTAVTVLVSNLDGARISASFPPPEPLHLRTGQNITFTVTVEGQPAGGYAIGWSLDGVPLDNNGSFLNYTAGPNSTGNHSVGVRLLKDGAVLDGRGWNLTVLPPNRPPEVSGFGPGDHNISVYREDTVRFNVVASDPEGKGLTFRWSLDLAPAPGGKAEETIDITFNSTGLHIVDVLVSDGEANMTLRWNVSVAEAPTLGLLDFLPCAVYIIIGLFLGIWYGRKTKGLRG